MSVEYDLITSGFGILPNAPRALIALKGEDRVEWLQGQATNDVRPLAEGRQVSFCLCQPTGQIEAVVDAYPGDGQVLLSTDAACKDAVLRRVQQMVVLEDVEAEDLTSLGVNVAVGPLANSLEAPLKLVKGEKVELWGGSIQTPSISDDTYNIWRLERGMPEWRTDITSRTLPPELGKAFEAEHVSYTKGCFTGQEILHRIYSRGHTNKTWVGLITDMEVRVGSAVTLNGKEVGDVTSSAVSPRFGRIAAAVLRNDAVGEGTHVSVDGTEATVVPLPFLK